MICYGLNAQMPPHPRCYTVKYMMLCRDGILEGEESRGQSLLTKVVPESSLTNNHL